MKPSHIVRAIASRMEDTGSEIVARVVVSDRGTYAELDRFCDFYGLELVAVLPLGFVAHDPTQVYAIFRTRRPS